MMSSCKQSATTGRLLVVDDEEPIRRGLRRILERDGHQVTLAADGREASRCLAQSPAFDAVVCDLRMPDMGGLDFLRVVRMRDLELPVILMTGAPDVASAIDAIDHGAYKYLRKPVDFAVLSETVRKAVGLGQMARLKREALAVLGPSGPPPADLEALAAAFDRALDGVWVAYQPIVRAGDGTVFGYEALLRSNEPTLPSALGVLDAAERLGRLDELGRTIRAAAARPMWGAGGASLFVNLHPRDLADEALFSADAPLSRIASRVILEITERASLEEVPDVRDCVARLRELGFRLAVDDLGAGYAGLTSFATLEPEVVKIDMSLVRNVDRSDVKFKVVERMTALAHDLKVLVVAEGVETREECEALTSIGCDLLQGYFFAKPGKPFPVVTLPERR